MNCELMLTYDIPQSRETGNTEHTIQRNVLISKIWKFLFFIEF
jgi:hypothetical protein